MKDQRKLLVIVVAILLALVVGIIFLAYKNRNDIFEVETDAEKFAAEFISLNGETDADGNEYIEVELDSLNPFVYQTESEIIKLLKSGTGVVIFGSSTNNQTRSAINMLNKAAISLGLEQVYYLDISSIRSEIELDDANNVSVTVTGTENYKKLLSALDSYLEEYNLEASDGTLVSTGEKRIYLPTVVVVKNGEIQAINVGTTDDEEYNEETYVQLDKDQNEKLYNTYLEMLKNISSTVCDEGC